MKWMVKLWIIMSLWLARCICVTAGCSCVEWGCTATRWWGRRGGWRRQKLATIAVVISLCVSEFTAKGFACIVTAEVSCTVCMNISIIICVYIYFVTFINIRCFLCFHEAVYDKIYNNLQWEQSSSNEIIFMYCREIELFSLLM